MVVGDVTTGTDVLVVGAGPAGYVAAIRAGQLDLDVTLVEKDAYGGTCLNYGCIPSKALITATDIAHEARHAEEMGIHADPAVDMAGLIGWKDDVVDQLTGGVEKLCKANQVNLLEGTATFADENTARISHSGDGQGSETLEFEHAIVATGSRPIEIPNFSYDDEPVLSSKDALDLESVPESLVVVGAGYIGMELASVFAKLGTDVTVVEMLDSILPGYDDDLKRPVKQRADDLGIEFEFGYTASEWNENGDDIRVTAEPAKQAATDGGAEAVEADALELDAEKVLVAVGRQPVSDTLGLEEAGVETDDNGFIETDSRARTSVDHIFAVGDVAGEPMLAHKGSAEGQVAAEVIAGEPAASDHQAMPAVVFTDPEIATVGMTKSEAEDAGFETVTGEFPLRASGRALTMDEPDGFVKIVAEKEGGYVLGAGIVAPEASELVAELGLAIELGATLEDVASTVHAHPTLSESVMEAAENALGHAIHTLNR
ncbi:dihydrolipoyl dehydrogenase [Natronobacterium gregoryi]|uniref:Dihydrolipoyl dehydrogenase n=2 Tax=Natronobacterium gregoryi TaxID=44930 RepID=L0AFE4_NATGS|nr:dihydrolipoyl dehydrogenase [Natronobacterium gregoryi]AFZ72561.1 dihydrolipoamide dehydrogenase [Natronobacterium gregoryi SP2]ELY71920.1 dihydrolipoamide dehydrogenase [Natronobacterium gregoryi SP2]PLK19357.1 dihydrolipoyl dehydrogenase [Natronobacterium gregoryi SP2]SFJ51997.1 dihydrolipoamide dehydrogenase [Natronobacterium gregoryi]